MIGYAIIGMPVNIILFTYLGEYFGKSVSSFNSNKKFEKTIKKTIETTTIHSLGFQFIKVYGKYKAYKLANNENYAPQRMNMIGKITLSLVPAAVVLVFLPSCLFTYFEGWPYSVSVYYSFVTLTTIGNFLFPFIVFAIF